MDTPLREDQTFPTRSLYDSSAEQQTAYIDVFPATADDVRVHVGQKEIRVTLGADPENPTHVFTPPTANHRFERGGNAVFNNGVLEISVRLDRS